MADNLKAGDKVTWWSHGGTAHGKVVKKLTGQTQIKGHQVAACEDNPQYLVETDDGKWAAHKPSALKRGGDEGQRWAESKAKSLDS
ncbi:MAG: DUF2945 domain-containing protein [Erythrobacter sp.]